MNVPADAYVGIDVAVADGKRLPICVSVWRDGRLVALPLKAPPPAAPATAWTLPPEMLGNVRMVDAVLRAELAAETVEYLRGVEEGWGVRIRRIGIDAPRAPRPPALKLRVCEAELKARGLSYFETPDVDVFARIADDVAAHLRDSTRRKGLPHANRIWMLFGFDLFSELSGAGWECLEVYPQATVRAIGAGERHKREPGAVLAQLGAAAAHTGWPDPVSLDRLRTVAFGKADDCLDAYLSAWVAALDEADREALGTSPHDAIWIPRVGANRRAKGSEDDVPGWPLTGRFDEALIYATHLHEGTFRKETSIPYVSHLLAVCARVLEDGGSEDEAIAALLHDAVEDAGGDDRLRAIRARFGDVVARIVDGCSDTDESPKPPWRERKERYIRHLRTEADGSTLRVSLADKLHNARAILRDHRAMGEAIWDRFNAPVGEQLWYFESLMAVFRERVPGPMADELAEVVSALRARMAKER